MAKEKSNIEILNEIRNQRNAEITGQRRTDISVNLVEFLGQGDQTEKKIFRLVEKQEFDGKPAQMLEKFYVYENEMPKLIGMRHPESGEILPVGMQGDETKLWDVEKSDIEKCIEEREKQLRMIAKELGISEEEIIGLSEIELEQKLQITADEKGKGQTEEEKQGEDSAHKLSEKQTKAISAGNEIKLNTQIDNKGKTLGKELGLEGYTKIVVVHAHRLTEMTDEKGNKGKRENLKFGFIAQRTDGTYETIPENKLRMYRGNNTEITGIKNPQEIETSKNDSVFEVVGTNKRLAIRQSSPYGIPEVYLARNTRDNDGNIGEKLQDQYDGTERTDVEVRDLFRAGKGEYQMDNMQKEAKTHEKAGCKEAGVDEIDGDPNTGHQHVISTDSVLEYQGTQMTVTQIAELARFKLSPEEFIEYYNESAQGRHEDFDVEEIYEEIEDRVNEEYRNPSQRNR